MHTPTGTLAPMEELREMFPESDDSHFRPVRTMTKRQDLAGKVEPYEPCTCGSGKKFKFCCYAAEQKEVNQAQAYRARSFTI